MWCQHLPLSSCGFLLLHAFCYTVNDVLMHFMYDNIAGAVDLGTAVHVLQMHASSHQLKDITVLYD